MSGAAPWVVVAGDFVRTGGMDAANHALAAGLAASGRQVHLVAHRVDAALAGLPGVTVHSVPRPLGSHLLGFPLLDRAGRRVARRLAERGVHVMANGGNCRAEGAATWLHYVHAAYRPEIAGRPLRRGVEALARKQALRDERAVVGRARVVICNSRLTARHAVELLGAPSGRVHVVYYGADAERFRPATDAERAAARAGLGLTGDAPALAFVGALGDRRKGFDALFAAVRRLCADPEWDARLFVAGTGGELEEWKRRAQEAGLAERIVFLGFRPDVREVLHGCDGIVSPTRYEAYGLAVQEALCLGVPAIVSRAAGVAERIPASLGPLLLDDPGDAEELARRLMAWRRGLVRHRLAAAECGGGLRAWTWEKMAARIVDIVEERG